MSGFEHYLPLIWAGLIGTAVLLYVVLDGFDLGIGILYPMYKTEEDHDLMMNSIAPYWDGNETWLVLGGGGLWVAFPKAYAIIMPGLYIPIIIMLLALIFRGVAFEFRWVAKPHHFKWNLSFTLGSLMAAFSQGVVLGGLLQGIKVVDGQFAGGPFDWLTPFSVLCGVGLCCGYALLGATWLILKTEGYVEQHARKLARPLLMAMLGAIVIISIWTPRDIPRIRELWFSMPNFLYLSPVPVLTGLLALLCWLGINDPKLTKQAFFSAVCIFILAFVGLVLSNVPYLVPPTVTVWEAAATPASQTFLLIGTSVLLPIILGYTALVYWTFRGKLKKGEGYH
ncbi:MAG: cytochrome d ubiquinol oxidase subunit II [Candidatus Berkiella sp.]